MPRGAVFLFSAKVAKKPKKSITFGLLRPTNLKFMNTILLITAVVLAIVLAVMAVLLRFDRRQNRIVDAKLVEQVERNIALEAELKQRNEELHKEQLQTALLRSENDNLRAKADQDKAQLEELQASFRAEFKNLANDILDEKQKSMTATNKESIDLMLKPLRDNITEFRTRISFDCLVVCHITKH